MHGESFSFNEIKMWLIRESYLRYHFPDESRISFHEKWFFLNFIEFFAERCLFVRGHLFTFLRLRGRTCCMSQLLSGHLLTAMVNFSINDDTRNLISNVYKINCWKNLSASIFDTKKRKCHRYENEATVPGIVSIYSPHCVYALIILGI